MKPDRNHILSWLEKAKEMKSGESLFLPCDSQQRQKELVAAFQAELKILSEICPEIASTLMVVPTIRNSVLWCQVKKLALDPSVAWLEKADGTKERVTIEPARNARVQALMEEDERRKRCQG